MKKTGDEYFDSDEFRDLLTTYEDAVSTGQPVFMDADELSEIADYYQMNGQAEEADNAINLALSLSPGAIMPLTYKIHEALYNNNVKEAEDYLSQIIETDEPDYLYDKAEIMLAKGLDTEVDSMMQEHLSQIPAEEQQDFIVDVANIFQENGFNEKSLEWLNHAQAENTTDYKELLARTLFGLGRYKDSEHLYNELIDTNPFAKQYWNALASSQLLNSEFSEAVQSSEYALAIDPQDSEALITKANGLYRLENYEKAAEYFQRYEDNFPDDPLALLYYGACLNSLGRTDEGIAKLRRAADLIDNELDINDSFLPYIVDIYEELAFALLESGQPDEALACIEKTDALPCDHTQMTVVKGHILLATNRDKEAEQAYSDAIINSDNPAQTFLRVAVSVYDNHNVKTAYNMLKTYFDIAPADTDEGYAYMVLCCYDLKLKKEFLHYLKEACSRNPKECRTVLAHLFPPEVNPEDYYNYIINHPQRT